MESVTGCKLLKLLQSLVHSAEFFSVETCPCADLPACNVTGIATRSYLYVEDVAEAFACVLHNGVVGEVYNIGTQKERTVLDVAQDIAKVFKLPESKIVHVRDRAFNDR